MPSVEWIQESPTGFRVRRGLTTVVEGRFELAAEGGPVEVEAKWQALGESAWGVQFRVRAAGREPTCISTVRWGVRLPAAAWPGPLWSLQGAAVRWGQDFAFPLELGFARENYLGHLQEGEGGGVPVVYCWNREAGLALMHLERVPIEWWMPVARDPDGVQMAFERRLPFTLEPGTEWESPTFALSWHERADFFAPLAHYREWMAVRGLQPGAPTPASYEAAWCSWGYWFDVRPQDVLDVLPIARELGIRWFTLDDRWFDAYGDWNPRPDLFPNGADDMRRLNEAIHAAGGFSQLWWYPLCAEDGYGKWDGRPHGVSRLIREHPDWVVIDAQGRVARNNRQLAMLCPALSAVQDYTLGLVRRFIEDWGFDGFKMDNIYTMPSCYNPAHGHRRPEDSIAAFGELYRQIFALTRQLRPESVVQICSCGTPILYSLLPATDQTVTADPISSAQVRQRIKFYKALHGPRAPIFADHVELSDGGMDFASAIGTGGVPGTKFTGPVPPERKAQLEGDFELTPEKREIWRFWLDLYQRYRLAEGEYLNLYDIAFDFPEGHAIRRNGRMYYAFFATRFEGEVELRGLEARSYRIRNYEQEVEYGTVHGPTARVHVAFDHHLLLEANPVEGESGL